MATDEPTLRDQLAMAALTGLLANGETRSPFIDVNVRNAWQYADDMLAAREASTDGQ